MLPAVTVLLVISIVVAQASVCQREDVGLSYRCPAVSCVDVFREPGRSNGLYWVKATKIAKEAIQVYCTSRPNNCGGEGVWMMVGSIYTGNKNKNVICPGDLLTWVYNRRTYCRSPDQFGCASVVFQTHGAHYTEVCGMVSGYQYYSTDAMQRGHINTADENYVDGASFTYGANPRKHLWTYAAGASANLGTSSGAHCPCSTPRTGTAPPAFVGDRYYCGTAVRHGYTSRVLYASSPLWDGRGICPGTCCNNPNMPWFRVVLNGSTTEHVEMRLCTDSGFANEAVAVDRMVLYVRVG